MWDLIVSVPDHCLSFYFAPISWASPGVHIVYSSQYPHMRTWEFLYAMIHFRELLS